MLIPLFFVQGAQTLMNQLFDENRVRTYANLTTNYTTVSPSTPFSSKPGPPPPHHPQVPQQSGVSMSIAPSPTTATMMSPGIAQHPHMVAIQNAPQSGYPMPPPHIHPGGYVVSSPVSHQLYGVTILSL